LRGMMGDKFKRILIIADIEGSSGCWDYRASSFMTNDWVRACKEMTRDVNAIVQALFQNGAESVRIKDFHRTGYNLLPELIDPRSEIVQGYRKGPVPGIGDPGEAEAVMFLGMHAASGTDGFLAHTLTSRIEQLEVNGEPLPEIQLFASSLAPWGLKAIFFSGCPVACRQAKVSIKNISVYPIDKSVGKQRFDVAAWRSGLQQAAVKALENDQTVPYEPEGPMRVIVKMRTGSIAVRKMARRWGLDCRGDQIVIDASDIHDAYMHLIRICYLTPVLEKTLPLGLWIYNLWGKMGLAWVRRRVRS
ncbi:M55 family metallopeptidase, partial [Thermodesulfobacteriota bacterium]